MWLGTGLLWGTTWGTIRIGLRDLPPLTFAAARTCVAAAALLALAWGWARAHRPRRNEFWLWWWLGLPQIGLPYALIFWAEQFISSGLTAMLFATVPALTAVVAHFVLRDEPLTAAKLAGSVVALVAVSLLVNPAAGGHGSASIVAAGAVLLAALASSWGAVLVRRYGRSTSTVWLTGIQVTSAAVFLVLLAGLFESRADARFTPAAVGAILYLALAVTVGCYLGLFWLLKHLDATFVSMGVIFETLVGVFFGAFVLGEPLGLRIFVGLGLVGISVALVVRSSPTAPQPPTP